MNFEKKLSEAYLDFMASVDKKAAKLKVEREVRPHKSLHCLPLVENDFEDLLFQGAQAQSRIAW